MNDLGWPPIKSLGPEYESIISLRLSARLVPIYPFVSSVPAIGSAPISDSLVPGSNGF